MTRKITVALEIDEICHALCKAARDLVRANEARAVKWGVFEFRATVESCGDVKSAVFIVEGEIE